MLSGLWQWFPTDDFSTMDLGRMKNEDKLELCRNYFLGKKNGDKNMYVTIYFETKLNHNFECTRLLFPVYKKVLYITYHLLI